MVHGTGGEPHPDWMLSDETLDEELHKRGEDESYHYL